MCLFHNAIAFGSTQTVNPISTKMGFCDGADSTKDRKSKGNKVPNRSNLACLDELVKGIEGSKGKHDKEHDPWQNFPALRLLLKDRVDFDSGLPMFRVEREFCEEGEKSPCKNQTQIDFGPNDVMDGEIFDQFSDIWREKNIPLRVKYDQLRQSWWNSQVPNMLNQTPERPHIKHVRYSYLVTLFWLKTSHKSLFYYKVVMAYGCDVPTEVAYIYKKTDLLKPVNSTSNTTASETDSFDGIPTMSHVIWEEKHGKLILESKLSDPSFTSFTDTILRKKKQIRRPFNVSSAEPRLHQSGDGTIPYISLMWAHTW